MTPVFNFSRKAKELELAKELVVTREGFKLGLQTGIDMVRIAAGKPLGADISLDKVADTMQQTLDEFRAEYGE
jgi:hypothetical protein